MTAAELAIQAIRSRSTVGVLLGYGVDVHFQPDAPTVDGRSVLDALMSDGRWRTQFETATSNGGLTAFSGGDRWRWESRLFDGAYDRSPATDRPAYGALRRTGDRYGSSPRFGSAVLRLGPTMLNRTTPCFPDSVFEPEAVGTVDAAGAVIAALDAVKPDDPLDRYVEAHVHGGVRLTEDLEAIVLDPSFRGGAIAETAARSGLKVEWHPGYALAPEDIAAHAEYRGEAISAAAIRVADGRTLTPAVLGTAVREEVVDAQTAKRVWHLLARFGRTGTR